MVHSDVGERGFRLLRYIQGTGIRLNLSIICARQQSATDPGQQVTAPISALENSRIGIPIRWKPPLPLRKLSICLMLYLPCAPVGSQQYSHKYNSNWLFEWELGHLFCARVI